MPTKMRDKHQKSSDLKPVRGKVRGKRERPGGPATDVSQNTEAPRRGRGGAFWGPGPSAFARKPSALVGAQGLSACPGSHPVGIKDTYKKRGRSRVTSTQWRWSSKGWHAIAWQRAAKPPAHERPQIYTPYEGIAHSCQINTGRRTAVAQNESSSNDMSAQFSVDPGEPWGAPRDEGLPGCAVAEGPIIVGVGRRPTSEVPLQKASSSHDMSAHFSSGLTPRSCF